MSIAEFSAALKNQAYKNWFKSSGKNIISTAVSVFRSSEEKAQKTSFIITRDTVSQIVEKLTGATDQNAINAVLKDLKNVKIRNRKGLVRDKGDTLYFPLVSFDTISRVILKQGFKSIESDKDISEFFEKGHVYGLASKIGARTVSNILSSNAIPEDVKTTLVPVLQDLVLELERQDEETANIKDSTYSLYARYKKKPGKYLVELQLKTVNQEAGREAALITNAIRRYLDPNNFSTIVKNLKERPQDSFIKELIESRGSPSFVDMASLAIVDAIKGKTESTKELSIPLVKIADAKMKINVATMRANIKKDKEQAKKLLTKLKQQPIVKKVLPGTSISSLESIIRARLALQIKENMGTGSATNVLNYRTGRFAESATIERATISRAGMVSVFYNYMRHPYGTFSEGGKQQYPRSRDPKALISKSIREIGSSLALNKMRAVLI